MSIFLFFRRGSEAFVAYLLPDRREAAIGVSVRSLEGPASG